VRAAVRLRSVRGLGTAGERLAGAMVLSPRAGTKRAAERNVLGVNEKGSSGESSSDGAGMGESVACLGIARHHSGGLHWRGDDWLEGEGDGGESSPPLERFVNRRT
jgi:hypothetical protein